MEIATYSLKTPHGSKYHQEIIRRSYSACPFLYSAISLYGTFLGSQGANLIKRSYYFDVDQLDHLYMQTSITVLLKVSSQPLKCSNLQLTGQGEKGARTAAANRISRLQAMLISGQKHWRTCKLRL